MDQTPTSPALCPPPFDVALPPQEILKRLETGAKRGRLPGLCPGREGELFAAEELGTPFDYRLSATASEQGGQTRLTFSIRMLPRMPAIFAAVLLFSVWPGVWLTDSMLHAYWPQTNFYTPWWYLPITILPIPWMWRGFVRKSRTSAAAYAAEFVDKAKAELST